MKKITGRNYVLLILLGSTLNMFSQNFNYSLSKDSSSYSDLSNPNILSSNENFQSKSFIIYLPFHFNFCGSICDSLTIENNGFIEFDKQKGLVSVAFNNYGSRYDNTNNFVSSLSYLTEGASGNRILKLQLKNIAKSTFSSTDYLNYQVWLYENGNKIEYHIGANYLSTAAQLSIPPDVSAEDRAQLEIINPVLMGFLNRNMDTTDKAYLIKGKTTAPSGQLISNDNELVYLNNIPAKGIILKFTPSF